MNDNTIIELYWARDERAITETEGKYGNYCTAIAGNLLSSREDREECVSDTWYQAWQTMPPQRPDSLRAYLGRIVRNISISRFRAQRAAKRGGMEQLLSELDECMPDCVSVEDEVETRRLTEVLEYWLEGLERQERVLFLRRYWYGDGVKELAKCAGTSQNAMAQRLRRLRLSLKETLEQEGMTL